MVDVLAKSAGRAKRGTTKRRATRSRRNGDFVGLS